MAYGHKKILPIGQDLKLYKSGAALIKQVQPF